MSDQHFLVPAKDGTSRDLHGSLQEGAESYRENGVIILKRAIAGNDLGKLGTVAPAATFSTATSLDEEYGSYSIDRYAYTEALLKSPVFAFIRAALNAEALLVPCQYMHHLQPHSPSIADQNLPLHQDGSFNAGAPITRIWFLLYPDSCGVESANMEFVCGGGFHIFPKEEHPDSRRYGSHEMSHRIRDALYERNIAWAPPIDRGDAVIFAGETPHRTNVPAGATAQRIGMHTSVCAFSEPVYEYYATQDDYGAFVILENEIHFVGKPRARVNIGWNPLKIPVDGTEISENWTQLI